MSSSNPNQLQEFLGIIRRRFWQVLLPAGLALAIGIAIANFLPKSYKVQTRVALHESILPGGAGATAIQRDIGSAPQMMKRSDRVREVLRRLSWQDFVSLSTPEQNAYVERVLERLVVQVKAPPKLGGTAFLTLQYTDSDGQHAEKFLNDLRDHYIAEEMSDLTERADSVLENYKEVMLTRKSEYEGIQNQLTELKKIHQISATQPGQAGAQRGEDSVKLRLDKDKEDLERIRRDLVARTAKRDTTYRIYEEAPLTILTEDTTPRTDHADDIDLIEEEIDDRRDEQLGKTARNSIYRKLEAEIRELEREKERLLAQVAPAETTSEWVTNPDREQLYKDVQQLDIDIAGLAKEEESLVASIQTAEVRHNELQEVYAGQALLANELQNKQNDYNSAVERFDKQNTMVDMLDGPEANPFEVLEQAQTNDVPFAPNVPAIIAFAAIVGLGLGLGSAFASEYMRNGYRTVGELTRSLAVPVLGAVNSIVTRAEARRRLAMRMMVGTSSMLMIGAILWVTWAYKNEPLMLGPQVTQLINDLREQFR